MCCVMLYGVVVLIVLNTVLCNGVQYYYTHYSDVYNIGMCQPVINDSVIRCVIVCTGV